MIVGLTVTLRCDECDASLEADVDPSYDEVSDLLHEAWDEARALGWSRLGLADHCPAHRAGSAR